MDYNKLLNKYNMLPIKVDGNIYNITKGKTLLISILDVRVKSYLNLIGKNNNEFNGIYFEVTRNGIKYNIEALIKNQCRKFGIEYDRDNNKLLDNIKNKILQLRDRYWNSTTNSKMSEQERNELLYLHRNYLNNTEILKRFSKLCEIRDSIYADDNLFDENKLGLYFAYDIIYKILNNCEDTNNESSIKKKEYLKDYILNNTNTFKDLSKDEQNKVKEMMDYFNINKNDINTKSNNKKYNYTFFESDGTMTNDKFNRMCGYSLNSDNSDELKELLKRKKNYYESLNYKELLIGKESFDGYIGFKIDNGMVILDKFFEKNGTIAKDNAVYIINHEEDFENITKLSKPKAIEAINKGLVDACRKVHNGNFEKNINKYIEEMNSKHLVKTK